MKFISLKSRSIKRERRGEREKRKRKKEKKKKEEKNIGARKLNKIILIL